MVSFFLVCCVIRPTDIFSLPTFYKTDMPAHNRESFKTLIVCDVLRLAQRPCGEPIWAHKPPIPPLHPNPMILNRTFETFDRIPWQSNEMWYVTLCSFYYLLIFYVRCLIIWQSECPLKYSGSTQQIKNLISHRKLIILQYNRLS